MYAELVIGVAVEDVHGCHAVNPGTDIDVNGVLYGNPVEDSYVTGGDPSSASRPRRTNGGGNLAARDD